MKTKRLLYFPVLGIGILLLCSLLYIGFMKKNSSTPSSFEQEQMNLIAPPSSLGDISVGNMNAPVVLVEYFSFTCPHCATFHKKVYPKIKSSYIDTGKVRMILRDFPLDNISLVASMLLRCTPKNSYEKVLNTLFEKQKQWLSGGDAKKALQNLSLYFGMSEEDYRACLGRQDLLKGLEEQRQLAIDAGINSTPTFFINKRKITGNQPYKKMKSFIDKSLKKDSLDEKTTQTHQIAPQNIAS